MKKLFISSLVVFIYSGIVYFAIKFFILFFEINIFSFISGVLFSIFGFVLFNFLDEFFKGVFDETE